MLFKKAFHEGLKSGAVTLTFRRWDKPKVKPGGRYRCHPIGVLEVDAISQVRAGEISDDDAKAAGFADRTSLISYLGEFGGPLKPSSSVYRVKLHYGGDGDRVEGALDTKLSDEDVEGLRAKLRKMDGKEPWIRKTLALIEKKPQVAASQLAKKLGRETAPFKADVVKLKKLGLTQSFEVGYELSPRGREFLKRSKGKW